MRREIITWSIVGALVIAAFAGTVLILNASLYSASGFVRSYLDALERRDADGALELAGELPGNASTELLSRDAMGAISDIRLVSDEAGANGVHHVVYAWESDGVAGRSGFDVKRTGTLLGLFSTWSFEASPLAVIQLSVMHDDRFTANGVDLVTPSQNEPSPYLAFAPGSYKLTHESTFLTAQPVTVTVSSPSSVVPGAIDIQANDKFVSAAQKAINTALDACTTQKVLLPTGCPFGQPVANRIVTDPVWSMITYPRVSLEPGADPDTWRMPPTAATAHLTVDVQSLFDGSISTLDQDVQFVTTYTIRIAADDQLVVTAQG